MHVQTKRIVLSVATVAAIGAGVYAWRASSEPVVLPEHFTSARTDAAAASADVVRLTDEVRLLVGEISAAERVGEHETAISRAGEAREKNETARQAAITLANRLQALAESLSEVPSARRRLAFDAVVAQLSVATEYVTYTSNLTTFLDAISATGGSADERNGSIREALAAVNESAARITDLNVAALAALASLDASL